MPSNLLNYFVFNNHMCLKKILVADLLYLREKAKTWRALRDLPKKSHLRVDQEWRPEERFSIHRVFSPAFLNICVTGLTPEDIELGTPAGSYSLHPLRHVSCVLCCREARLPNMEVLEERQKGTHMCLRPNGQGGDEVLLPQTSPLTCHPQEVTPRPAYVSPTVSCFTAVLLHWI